MLYCLLHALFPGVRRGQRLSFTNWILTALFGDSAHLPRVCQAGWSQTTKWFLWRIWIQGVIGLKKTTKKTKTQKNHKTKQKSQTERGEIAFFFFWVSEHNAASRRIQKVFERKYWKELQPTKVSTQPTGDIYLILENGRIPFRCGPHASVLGE